MRKRLPLLISSYQLPLCTCLKGVETEAQRAECQALITRPGGLALCVCLRDDIGAMTSRKPGYLPFPLLLF